MSTKKISFNFTGAKKTQEPKTEAYDASKPFSPRIPVVNLIPPALTLKYDKLNLIRKVGLMLLTIVLAFTGIWLANLLLSGAQTVASNAVSDEINGLQEQVAKVEPYQKYLEGIELTRKNMSKVFAKNVDMSAVMSALVTNSNANNVTLSNIKISEVTTTTEQNTCINSNPFNELEQVGCINMSGTAKTQADVIAFFDAMGKTEGLSNAFITSMGSGAGSVIFSGSVSMNEKIYVSNLDYLSLKIDDILKAGGLTSSKIAKTETAKPEPTKTEQKPEETTQGTTTKTSNVDTRFANCEEAIDAGFGPYVEGVDQEYEWYQKEDTQLTGKVCVA